jgi:hypothetical protein
MRLHVLLSAHDGVVKIEFLKCCPALRMIAKRADEQQRRRSRK